jgi:hypothetical protein
MSRFVGISIMPEYFQVEGAAVLDRIVDDARATAIVTSPCVMEPAEGSRGTREPPVVGALLDRPLWGQRELTARVAPSFNHRTELYRYLRYKPPSADDLTVRDGHLVSEFIETARAAGLETYLRIQAAAPPGYRAQFSEIADEDEPRLPDGSKSHNRIDRNASLASPHVKAYLAALLVDLCAEYPNIDGFHVDWAEYPPYSIDSVFFDFSEPAMAAAEGHGIDTERMRRDCSEVMRGILTSIGDCDLARFGDPADGWQSLLAYLQRHAGFIDLLRLKALLVNDILITCRQALDGCGAADKTITPMAFPPPWNLVSGFDYANVSPSCSSIALKLIPSHWPMILGNYARAVVQGSPSIDRTALVRSLAAMLAITDGPYETPLSEISAGADESFVAGKQAQISKIRTAQYHARDTPVIPLVHSVGPEDEFADRISTAYEAGEGRIWINRYAFLSDAKIARIGRELA